MRHLWRQIYSVGLKIPIAPRTRIVFKMLPMKPATAPLVESEKRSRIYLIHKPKRSGIRIRGKTLTKGDVKIILSPNVKKK